MKEKLQARDLINVGVFTAIYFVVIMAIAMLGYIPIFIVLLGVLCPLIGGIPFMLYLTKVKKFGMVLITGIICGILMLAFGMGYWSIFTTIVFGIIAEFILKSGDYKSSKKSVLSYGIFSMWFVGNYIPMFVTRNQYFESLRSGFGDQYVNTLLTYTPNWSFWVLFASCFISGILGGLLGRKVLKKHFERAGIL